jgi:hypothetical protein
MEKLFTETSSQVSITVDILNLDTHLSKTNMEKESNLLIRAIFLASHMVSYDTNLERLIAQLGLAFQERQTSSSASLSCRIFLRRSIIAIHFHWELLIVIKRLIFLTLRSLLAAVSRKILQAE